eukprot:CAMPEP_0203746558 /NCGR_PEP_ID=MMETSP0098-20131031/1964_1 /ASSEMBLY_ACC=CAM_ASM_000208 /TAXON_ID=96639 /ORGANISM=" , Strain NY0313808BC1" /LENGTH=336 /DNA_ID=CAMNT_0050634695 /DNA_START=139 /DNA_END=1149 /DNA_ORIENTATION=-
MERFLTEASFMAHKVNQMIHPSYRHVIPGAMSWAQDPMVLAGGVAVVVAATATRQFLKRKRHPEPVSENKRLKCLADHAYSQETERGVSETVQVTEEQEKPGEEEGESKAKDRDGQEAGISSEDESEDESEEESEDESEEEDEDGKDTEENQVHEKQAKHKQDKEDGVESLTTDDSGNEEQRSNSIMEGEKDGQAEVTQQNVGRDVSKGDMAQQVQKASIELTNLEKSMLLGINRPMIEQEKVTEAKSHLKVQKENAFVVNLQPKKTVIDVSGGTSEPSVVAWMKYGTPEHNTSCENFQLGANRSMESPGSKTLSAKLYMRAPERSTPASPSPGII